VSGAECNDVEVSADGEGDMGDGEGAEEEGNAEEVVGSASGHADLAAVADIPCVTKKV
jgi:hypothetical protein